MKKGFTEAVQVDIPLGCRMPGCRNSWAVDISHGRVCGYHDELLSRSHGNNPPTAGPRHQAPRTLIPAAQFQPHWPDVETEREEF